MIAIRPRADQAAHPGERITVERPEPDDLITIAEEVTLPERVHLAEARRLTREEVITCTTDDATWLHAVLGEMIGAGDEPGLEDAEPDRLLARHRRLTRLIGEDQDEDGRPRNPVVHQALILRRAEVERALAVSNARAVARESDIRGIARRAVYAHRLDVCTCGHRRGDHEGGEPCPCMSSAEGDAADCPCRAFELAESHDQRARAEVG